MSNELSMRYGCNPHQSMARCISSGQLPIVALNDAPSYINLMDALNSWQLVRELRTAMDLPAAASFKHVSPAGAAVGVPLTDELRAALFVQQQDLSPLACAYARARGADRMASFGDWIALSDPVDVSTAELIRREVSDGVIAPDYEEGALDILKKKKGGKYRVVKIDPDFEPDPIERRQIFGLELEQRRNDFVPSDEFFSNIVTQNTQMGADAIRDLTVATIGVKYTQSNSVVLAVDGQLVGVGAGQQSRIHCVRLAADKADRWYLRQHPVVRHMKFAKGLKRPDRDNAIDLFFEEELTTAEEKAWRSCFAEVPERLSAQQRRQWLDGMQGIALSSDAFFPFRDNIDRASRSGVKYVVEAGGSIGDDSVIAAANEYGMVVVFSGVRLFHH